MTVNDNEPKIENFSKSFAISGFDAYFDIELEIDQHNRNTKFSA